MNSFATPDPLPGMQPEQFVLPGFVPVQPPLMRVVEETETKYSDPSPDQLRLEGQQEVLSPLPQPPCQLQLIDEPLIFEQSEPPKPPKGRLAKKRARAGITPGQGTLF